MHQDGDFARSHLHHAHLNQHGVNMFQHVVVCLAKTPQVRIAWEEYWEESGRVEPREFH